MKFSIPKNPEYMSLIALKLMMSASMGTYLAVFLNLRFHISKSSSMHVFSQYMYCIHTFAPMYNMKESRLRAPGTHSPKMNELIQKTARNGSSTRPQSAEMFDQRRLLTQSLILLAITTRMKHKHTNRKGNGTIFTSGMHLVSSVPPKIT